MPAMKKRWLAVVLVMTLAALSSAVLSQQCTIPTSGMTIGADTLLCAGTYVLAQGITITSPDTVLDCNGATLRGPGMVTATSGITVTADGVDVRNCIVQNFGVGLRARGVLNLRQTGLSLTGNGQETDVAAGEEITLPGETEPPLIVPISNATAITPTTPVPPAPPVTPPKPELISEPTGTPPAPSRSTPNTSIWLVQDVKSEALLENSLSFEYNATVPEAVLSQRVDQLRDFLENVDVQREFVYRGGQTTVKITLKPKSGFFRRVIYENITLYEYIPKCFAQLVDNVVFENGQPKVLEPDPLIRKVLGKGELTLQYSSKVVVSPECQALFKVIGVGTGKQVKTLGSVLAQEGIVQVVKVFPGESATVLVFIVLLAGTGIWYKREIDRVG
jgi:hypothetical protein